jgi:uracil-DNA glycosylase family 4
MSDVSQTDPPDIAEAAGALFEWYAAMGVDTVVGDAAVDRFALTAALKAAAPARTAPRQLPPGLDPRSAPRPAAPPVPAASQVSAAATVPNEEAVMAARAAAASAASLEELKALVERFEGCNLKLTAKSTVFGDGNPAASVMLVGESPGRDEDIEGRPFVGRSGQLLDRMLEAAGMPRATGAYIANVIYWRPPGNRDPSDLEVAICRPFILRQIELVRPKALVLLGAQPMKALVGGEAGKSGIRKVRGRWIDLAVGDLVIPAMPTYHPAYLLRQPLEKRAVWRDLLAVRERLGKS